MHKEENYMSGAERVKSMGQASAPQDSAKEGVSTTMVEEEVCRESGLNQTALAPQYGSREG